MQISPINLANPANIKTQKRQAMPQFELQADTVTFTSNAKKLLNISQKGEKFGEKLFELYKNNQLTYEKIQAEVKKNIPIAEIRDIKEASEIPVESESYIACTAVKYGNDGELKKITLYANFEKITPKEIGHISHEYTHCLQRYAKSKYNGIANLVNNNLLQTRILNNISAMVFADLDTHKEQKNVDTFKENLNNSVSEKMALYKAYGFNSEKEYTDSIKILFDNSYSKIIKMALANKEVAEILPFKDDPLKLKKIIKDLCIERARDEAEAYTVQKNIIEKHAPEKLTVVDIMSPILYQSFADSLS